MKGRVILGRGFQLAAALFVHGVKLYLLDEKLGVKNGYHKGWLWKASEGRECQRH